MVLKKRTPKNYKHRPFKYGNSYFDVGYTVPKHVIIHEDEYDM